MCRYFNTPSGCRYGDRCRYQHGLLGMEHVLLERKPGHHKLETMNMSADFDEKKTQLKEILCGECGELMKGTEASKAADLLKDHYVEKISVCDVEHIVYFKECSDFELFEFYCHACSNSFEDCDVTVLIKHLCKKIRKNKKKLKHQEQLDKIAMAFVDRDCEVTIKKNDEKSGNEKEPDVATSEAQANNTSAETPEDPNNNKSNLNKDLENHPTVKDLKDEENIKIAAEQLAIVPYNRDGCDDTGSDEDSCTECTNLFKHVDRFTRRLLDVACDPQDVSIMLDYKLDTSDDDDPTFAAMMHHFVSWKFTVGDSDDDDDRMFNMGFSNDDLMELASQGIKPWDPEAWDALAILNGEDDYF